MSVEATRWVWKFSVVGGTDRLVLLAIADCANDYGGNSWPSIKTIAEKCRVSEATVQRTIARLRDAGHLEVEYQSGGFEDTPARRRPNRYKVVGVADCDPTELSGSQNRIVGVAKQNCRGRMQVRPEPETLNVQDIKLKPPYGSNDDPAEVSVAEEPRPTAHAPLGDVPQNERDTQPEPAPLRSISTREALAAMFATTRADANGSDIAPPPSSPPTDPTNGHHPPANGKPDLEAVVAVYNANRGTLPSVRKVPSSPNARSALLRMWEDADGDVALIGMAVKAASQDPHYQGGADHHPYGLVTIARHFAERWQGIASRKREQDAELDRWRPAE